MNDDNAIQISAADAAEGMRMFIREKLSEWKYTLPEKDKHFADDFNSFLFGKKEVQNA
jgi:hypothetical protein